MPSSNLLSIIHFAWSMQLHSPSFFKTFIYPGSDCCVCFSERSALNSQSSATLTHMTSSSLLFATEQWDPHSSSLFMNLLNIHHSFSFSLPKILVTSQTNKQTQKPPFSAANFLLSYYYYSYYFYFLECKCLIFAYGDLLCLHVPVWHSSLTLNFVTLSILPLFLTWLNNKLRFIMVGITFCIDLTLLEFCFAVRELLRRASWCTWLTWRLTHCVPKENKNIMRISSGFRDVLSVNILPESVSTLLITVTLKECSQSMQHVLCVRCLGIARPCVWNYVKDWIFH